MITITINTFYTNFPVSEGGRLSDVLVVLQSNNIFTPDPTNVIVETILYSGSLSGYLQPLAPTFNGTPWTSVQSITETGRVQTAIDNQYGLTVQFRSDVVPIPAAAFFVAPALAGVFGFSRRKRSEA